MENSRVNFALLVGLVMSILLNVYEANQISTLSRDIATYDASEVMLGGTEIETDAAKRLVSDYATAHPDPEIRGFLFSRKAFENILADENVFTSINMYLVGNDKNSLRIILRGTNSKNTGITTDYDNHIFIAQSLCPNDCNGW